MLGLRRMAGEAYSKSGNGGQRLMLDVRPVAGAAVNSPRVELQSVAITAIRNPYLDIVLRRRIFDAVESDMAIDAIEPVVRLQRVAGRALERRAGLRRVFRRVTDETIYLLRPMRVFSRMAGTAGGKVYLGECVEDARLAGVRVVSGHRVTTPATRRKAVRVAMARSAEGNRPAPFIAAFCQRVDMAVLLDVTIPAEFGRAGGAGVAAIEAAAGEVCLCRLVTIGAREPVGMDVAGRAVAARVDTPLRQRGRLLRWPEEPYGRE